jgi:hypothetical protein
MTQLHEVLAVEGDLAKTAKKIGEETVNTFSKKGAHFLGHHKTLTMFAEDRQQEAEGAEDSKTIVETVPDKLRYTAKSFERFWACILQKEATNQVAKADLEVDGMLLGSDLPATFLLGMEHRLVEFRNVIAAAPTHEPGVEWVKDPDSGADVFRSKTPILTKREEKTMASKVLYEATKEHPAQIERWSENQAVGVYKLTKWTATVSPAKKAELLERCDALIQAVKKARQRANKAQVVKQTAARAMLDFVLGDMA